MTPNPKYKAEQLYKSYELICNDHIMEPDEIKDMCIYHVDDILNNFGTLTEGKQHYAAYCTIHYFEKVKKEIEKL